MEDEKTIPNLLLKREREIRGWSQAYVAEQIGAPASYLVSRWERGVASPSPYYRQKLCLLYGKNAEELALIQRGIGTNKPQRDYEATVVSAVVLGLDQPSASAETQADKEREIASLFDGVEKSTSKLYRGWRWCELSDGFEILRVLVNANPLLPFNRHGPGTPAGGFEWGYRGAGPATLAVSILADYFGEQSPQGWASRETSQAMRYYGDFKDEVVAWFPHQWELSSEQIRD